MSPGSPMDLATLFGVNDDFTKKMQEWEEKKKKIITKGSPLISNITAISGSTKFSEDFIRKMEEWEQKKGLGGSKPVVGTDGASSCRMSPEGSGNPLSPPPPTGDEVQRFLSESFSRTVQDWEEVRRRHSQSKEREKSKKVRSVSRERDKSQQRLEKQLKKIQKKEQKLEQELRKLSELRLKIDHQLETSSTSEKAPTDRRISQEGLKIDGWSFPRSEDQSTKGSVDTPKSKNSRFKKESPSYTRGRDEAQGLSDGACTAPVSPSTGSGRHQSASLSQSSLDSLSSEGSQSLGNAELTRSRDGSLGRCRRSHSDRQSSSSYRRTQSSPGSGLRFKGKAQLQENDALTRRTEEQLRRRVEEKEDEVAALQNEVHQLTNQINNLNKVYSETIDQFQRDLWSSNRLQGQQQVIQSDEVSIILSQLTNRLDLLQQHGDRMAKELSQTQTKICKEANNRRQTEQQLLHNLEQLHWIIESPTASSSLAEVVLHLCSYLTKLLSKASVLRQCISERNLLIQELERHLLVQEVINKLLHADIERHAIELSHLKEFQRLAVIKRWKTFNGSDHLGREEQTSEMSKSHEPVFPKIPQSSKKVQALLTQMVNDPDSLDIDTDWLTTIKKDAELALNLVTRGIQTDCFIALPSRSRDTTNASVQTVMTFCDCDYVPAQLPSPSTPFRRVASTSSSSHPPLFITPSCNSPSSSRNVIPVDKCFLFPGIYAQDCDMNYVNSYKPRKSSAPEISTDDGENPVWLRSSAFRAISSSYSERIQDLDEQSHDKDSKVPQSSSGPVSSVNAENSLASLVNVPSAKSVKNVKNDVNPKESGVGNTMTVSTRSPYKEPLPQPHSNKENTGPEGPLLNLTIVDKLSNPSVHSPMIQSKSPWKQKRANARSNECQEGEGRLPKASHARPGFLQSKSCNVDRFMDGEAEKEDQGEEGPVEEGPGEEDTDVVFSSSEDGFCWNGNVARLRETQIDESFDIPEGQEDQDGSTTSRQSLSLSQSVDQRRAGSWSGCQDSEKRGTSINRPIVVRKLKSATELMHDCRKKRSRAASVSDERYTSPYTKNAPDTATKDQQKYAGRGHFPPTDALSQSSFDSAGFERRRSEDSRNGSSGGGGSDAEKYLCHPDLSPVVGSEGAPPASISKDCNRFKPITPVLKAAARGQQTVKSIMVESSSETIDLAPSGYQPMSSSTYQQRSCTSSCSSIPTVEMNFISTAPLSNRNRGVYAKENAPESPAAPAGGRGSRKGSRSQPGLSPRAGSRAARSMCRALCLQAMSVELTDDSTDSSLSHPFTPHASSTPSPYPYSAPIQSTSAPVQSTEQEPEFHHKGRGNWLQKPKKLFKALK